MNKMKGKKKKAVGDVVDNEIIEEIDEVEDKE